MQINNWNENRKTKKSEINYALSIKNDLIGDQQTIDFIISDTQKRYEAFKKMIQHLTSFDSIKDARPLFTLMLDNYGFTDLKVQDYTIEILKNSGTIEIISSEELRTVLQNYYDTVEVIYIQQNSMNNYLIGNQMENFFNYLECEKGIQNNTIVPFDDRAKKNLPDAYAFIDHWTKHLNGYIQMLERLKNRNNRLIDLIDRNYKRGTVSKD